MTKGWARPIPFAFTGWINARASLYSSYRIPIIYHGLP